MRDQNRFTACKYKKTFFHKQLKNKTYSLNPCLKAIKLQASGVYTVQLMQKQHPLQFMHDLSAE